MEIFRELRSDRSWQLTFVKISFKVNGVGSYLTNFQNQRLFFFTTTQRMLQHEEEFKSTTGWRVDRPVSFTNCFEQHSNSAILDQRPSVRAKRFLGNVYVWFFQGVGLREKQGIFRSASVFPKTAWKRWTFYHNKIIRFRSCKNGDALVCMVP